MFLHLYKCRRLFILAFPTLSSRPLRTALLASRLSVRPNVSHSFSCHDSQPILYKEASLTCSVRSFFRALLHSSLALALALASLRSAQLCLAHSARFCSSSCLAFSLLSPRASPIFSSRLDTPHHK